MNQLSTSGTVLVRLAKEKNLVLADCLQSLVSTLDTIETTPAMTEAEDELSSGQR
jgi:hypothetical protein